MLALVASLGAHAAAAQSNGAAPARSTAVAETDERVAAPITAAEVRELVAVLAADSLEGRGAGTPGGERAARFVAERFHEIGLAPPGAAGASRPRADVSLESFLQAVELSPRVESGPRTRLLVVADDGRGDADSIALAGSALAPLAFSAAGAAAGPLVVAPAGAAAGRGSPQLRGAVALLAGASPPGGLRSRVEELVGAGATAVLVLADPRALPPVGGPVAAVPVLALAPDAAEDVAAAAGLDLLTVVHGGEARPSRRATVRVEADLVRSPRATVNVVGILHGSDPTLAGEAVLVGAHHDHLGWGGPGSLAPGLRAVHNGADDNASGVAGLVELAERFASAPPPRTLVFVAFGGEEEGLLGSSRYVEAPAWPLERTVAMLNLDMIGRLRERLTAYGTGSSSAWPGLLRDLAGDLEVAQVPDGLGPSDHASFYARGIPVLALFTGAHDDYHRPTDDVERLDAAGEVRVLELAARLLERLAGPAPRIAFTQAPVTLPRPMAFSVALGTIPDYGYPGPGLRLTAVRPEGPAARAGLRSGDVIVRLAGREVSDVYGYTAVLAELEPEVEVEVVFERDGRRDTATVQPEAR